MSTRLTLLPRRSSLQPGESLSSFLLRLEKLNYYAPGMIEHLCRQATGNPKAPINPAHARQAHTFVHLSVLTGLDPAQLFTASVHGFAPVLNSGKDKEYITLPGGQTRPLLDWHNRSRRSDNRAQFCPLCLKTATYHRQIWSLNLTMLCVEHQCMLARRCPGCGGEITVAQVVSGRCQTCQADLSQALVAPVVSDAPEMMSQQLIQRWLTAALAPTPLPDKTTLSMPYEQIEDNVSPGELLNKGQVMQILDLPEGALTRLTGSGRLGQARVPVGQTRLLLFRRGKVLEIAREWTKGLSMGDVCCWLDLAEKVIVSLVKIGALRLEQGAPQSRNSWLFDRRSIVEFVKAIADKLKPTSEVSCQVSLAAASEELQGIHLDSAALLNLVAEGRLQAYHRGAWRDNLLTLHFAQADIAALVKATVTEHNWVSEKQLARRLGMSATAIFSLRAENYGEFWYNLPPIARYAHTLYFEPQAVEQFCANCLTGTQAANLLGVSRARLMQQYVYSGRLQAIAEPRRDGSRRYLFWRKDVEWQC